MLAGIGFQIYTVISERYELWSDKSPRPSCAAPYPFVSKNQKHWGCVEDVRVNGAKSIIHISFRTVSFLTI
jgi:hypothetical protein